MADPPILTVHGHFYQPPRWDPWTGRIPPEAGAEPWTHFNEKIAAECYEPNARLGNFERISFDLGPTLALWMERERPRLLERILLADRIRPGAALAQAYGHPILPLLPRSERRVQIAWGIRDFRRRFGRRPRGLWLPETAVDLAVLEDLADAGIAFTVVAPWQVEGEVEDGRPVEVLLPSGRPFTLFVFSPLSGRISFEDPVTENADRFVAEHLEPLRARGGVLLASDGELYGHHKAGREWFLLHLLERAAPAAGWQVLNLEEVLARRPPRRRVRLRERTSWSCFHDLARWRVGCACTTPSGAGWKGPLARALDGAAGAVEALWEEEAPRLLRDPERALEEGYDLIWGLIRPTAFWARHLRPPRTGPRERRARGLLEAQHQRQLARASCAFFFEDLDRREPRLVLAHMARALELLWKATGERGPAEAFLGALQEARSPRTGRTGAHLLAEVWPAGRPGPFPF